MTTLQKVLTIAVVVLGCILRRPTDIDAFHGGQYAEQIAHPKLCVNGKGNPAKCAPLTHNPGCARWYTSRSKA